GLHRVQARHRMLLLLRPGGMLGGDLLPVLGGGPGAVQEPASRARRLTARGEGQDVLGLRANERSPRPEREIITGMKADQSELLEGVRPGANHGQMVEQLDELFAGGTATDPGPTGFLRGRLFATTTRAALEG